MHPVISVSSYIIMQAVVLILTIITLRKSQLPVLIRKGFMRVFLPVLVLLVSFPVLGMLLPDSSVKFALQGTGNIFLAFFTYYTISIIAASSLIIPQGSPASSRSIRPPAGSGVSDVTPAISKALLLAHKLCMSSE